MSPTDRQPTSRAPSLSPALILGFALRPLPRLPAQAAASLAMALLSRRHRGVFERLGELTNPDFLIDPVDLPLRFLLSVAPATPRLTVLDEDEPPPSQPAATIRGTLPVLIDLLEGRIDGDALFFARSLVVEGDMAAVVALRNAVDGAEISLVDDLLPPLGPMAGPLQRLVQAGGALYRRMEADLETLRAAFVGPVSRRCDQQDRRIRDLDQTVAGLAARRKARRA